MAKCDHVKRDLLFGRQSRQCAVLFATSLWLAGCATVVPRTPPQIAPPVVQTPTESKPPLASELPRDVGRHRVALLVPMTGTNAGVGQAIANAANMAVLETGGQNLRVTIYDTANGPGAAAQKALVEGNQLILGPLLAEDVRSVAPIARAAHVPVVSFTNDSSIGGNGVWAMGFAPNQAINRVVSFAAEKGMTKIAGLAPNGLYGQRAATALLRATENAGGQVVSVQNYDHTAPSRLAAVSRLKQGSPFDAVLVADQGKDAVILAPLIRKSGAVSAHILGTELWNVDHGLGQSPALRGAWYASVSDALYAQLATKYRARFGKAPPRLASLGFDAVLLATNIARDWKSGAGVPVNKLTDKGGFVGIDGVFRFTKDGVAERSLQVNEITATGTKIVSPAPQSLGN